MRSFTGRRWALIPAGEAQVPGLHPVAARCLSHRAPVERAAEWLHPTLEHLHDPYLMLDMDRAVARVRRAIQDRERVRIVTDYDVDGTTSSLILQSTLRLLGAGERVDYHIPDRATEGYGFSVQAARRAIEQGVGLILTADIGVRDHEAVSVATQGGVDVIVCDHHLPAGEDVPADAHAVLCPPRTDCQYPNPDLAACGVSLKLAQALLAEHPSLPALTRSLLKIAAIGTVADVVSLRSLENRAIVSLGLAALRASRNSPGLAALLQVAGVGEGPITASDLGFRVGPRINAAGRIQSATEVISLFDERDPDHARRRAKELDQLNQERRQIQTRLEDLGALQLPDPAPDFGVVWGNEADGWHPGVVGIVAARLRDRIDRPVAVVSVREDEARGSVRSVPSVHAVRALEAVSDLLRRFGGHAAAAGFSIAPQHLPELARRLDAWVRENTDPDDLIPVTHVDATVTAAQLDDTLAQGLDALRPFGKGNPQPRLQVSGVQPTDVRPMGTRHLRFRLGGVDAVWWQGAEHAEQLDQPLDLVGTLGWNHWRGRSTLRFTVSDARPAAPAA